MKSDLELVLAAHVKDSALVEQVMNAGELAQQDIRLLLTLIAAGKLRSNPVCTLQHWYIPPICTRPHYPAFPAVPSYPYWTNIGLGTNATSNVTVAKGNEVYTLG